MKCAPSCEDRKQQRCQTFSSWPIKYEDSTKKLAHLSASIVNWFDPIRKEAIGEHPTAVRQGDKEKSEEKCQSVIWTGHCMNPGLLLSPQAMAGGEGRPGLW